MTENEQKVMALILAPNPTNYRIWQDTGVHKSTLSKLKNGIIDVGNLSSTNFNKLLEYYHEKESIINE